MKDFLLILIIVAALAGGYFVMGWIDRFLASSCRNEPSAYQKQAPSCIMLTDRLSDEELIRSVRQFAKQHGPTCIILQHSPPDDGPPHDADGTAA